MGNQYIGEIRMFAGPFAPRDWAYCNGQLLSIAENQPLFSLIHTTYGGDGRTNFALPDLRGRIPLSLGNDAYGDSYQLAQHGGEETITLTNANMRQHNHDINVYSQTDSPSAAPNGAFFGPAQNGTLAYGQPSVNEVALNGSTLGVTGTGEPIHNMHPYSCVNFIIALFGTYPPRS